MGFWVLSILIKNLLTLFVYFNCIHPFRSRYVCLFLSQPDSRLSPLFSARACVRPCVRAVCVTECVCVSASAHASMIVCAHRCMCARTYVRVHMRACVVVTRVPWISPAVRSRFTVITYLQIRCCKLVWNIPSQCAKLLPLVHDGVEETQTKQESLPSGPRPRVIPHALGHHSPDAHKGPQEIGFEAWWRLHCHLTR